MYIGLSHDRFDIALLDPPYNKQILDDVLPVVAEKMTDYGVILCESELREVLPETAGEFSIYREYRYGKIKITAYRKNK